MKKIIIAFISLIFLFSSVPAFSAGGYVRRNNNLYKKQDVRRPSPKVYKKQYHHGHSYRYTHHGRHYTYLRHYRWNEWNRIRNDRRYHNGHYHSDNGYLMFSFCDPDNGLCFSISLD